MLARAVGSAKAQLKIGIGKPFERACPELLARPGDNRYWREVSQPASSAPAPQFNTVCRLRNITPIRLSFRRHKKYSKE
jgi:hypothetical protein